MKSIISDGGPLVCMEVAISGVWRGVADRPHSAGADNEYNDDYQRACSITGYSGKLPVGDGFALVLGDMPLETFIWEETGRLPIIVRVMYAEADADITKILSLRNFLPLENPDENIMIDFRTSQITVFDSAYIWTDKDLERLLFEMPAGSYLVSTKAFEPDENTSVVVHVFTPAN